MENTNSKRWTIILLIIIIFLLCILIGFLAYGYLNDPAEPESPLQPTVVPTEVQATNEGPIVFQTFTVDQERILEGECANISWQVDNADLIQLKKDGILVLDLAPAQHTYQACHDQYGIYVYRLEAENGSGSSNWIELQIIVDSDTSSSSSSPAATLPPAEGSITINYFYVEPQRINVGQCATIFWEVSNADQVRLIRDETLVLPYGQLEDEFADCHNERSIYRYRLEVENSGGISNFMELQVIVDP